MLLFIFALFFIPIVVLKIYCVLVRTRCKSKVCLSGKTALVIGGNSGIGYQIVLELASRGCRVIVGDKVEDPDLKRKILRETNNDNMAFHYVDLASFKSVREFGKRFVKSENRLDILIHNAGIGRAQSTITEDGLDIIMQVNYFSPFLLTHLLIDVLKKSSGRVIFTSSALSYFNDFSLEKLKPTGVRENYLYCYPNSKLCLIFIADLFAQKLIEYKITSNSYHPGLVKTNIFREANKQSTKIDKSSVWIKTLEIAALLFGKTPEEGAQTAIYLACANEVKDTTGKFFYETKPTFKPSKAYDEKLCNAAWKASEEIVKLEPHEKL